LKISVVIPTLNEARNIGTVLRAMPAEVDEIVIVDGFSVDGTVNAATAACPDVKIVRQG
jgi:glycosyltransferase involved in cell wall biosynthesis